MTMTIYLLLVVLSSNGFSNLAAFLFQLFMVIYYNHALVSSFDMISTNISSSKYSYYLDSIENLPALQL